MLPRPCHSLEFSWQLEAEYPAMSHPVKPRNGHEAAWGLSRQSQDLLAGESASRSVEAQQTLRLGD